MALSTHGWRPRGACTLGLTGGRGVVTLLLCLTFHPLWAKTDQTGPLIPDRPGFYCGSLPVPKGFIHLESGLSLQWSREGGLRDDSLSTPVVARIGVLGHLEVRVATPGFVRNIVDTPDRQTSRKGFGGANVGVKWQFKEAPEVGLGASMALLFSLNLPVGSDFAKPSRAEPGFTWAADWSLPKGFGLATNLGIAAPYDALLGERFADLFVAAALGRGVGTATGLFIELAGTRPQEGHGEAEIFMDGGVTYLVNDDLQLDASLTRGLNEDSADWTLGVGISLRFR